MMVARRVIHHHWQQQQQQQSKQKEANKYMMTIIFIIFQWQTSNAVWIMQNISCSSCNEINITYSYAAPPPPLVGAHDYTANATVDYMARGNNDEAVLH